MTQSLMSIGWMLLPPPPPPPPPPPQPSRRRGGGGGRISIPHMDIEVEISTYIEAMAESPAPYLL